MSQIESGFDKDSLIKYGTGVRRKEPQLALQLTARQRWGGRRSGAGRKRQPGRESSLRHGSRQQISRPVPAHVTLRLLPGLLSLRTVRLVHEIEETFSRGCERSEFRLVHYSLQGNHAHLIVEARDHNALGRGMKAIGARLARAVNRVMHRSGRVLADRYHLRVLRTPREVRNALRYVLLNARRHLATAKMAPAKVSTVKTALPRAVDVDPASSARWFDGWKGKWSSGALEPPAARAVSRARTWLLSVGWRRHGLLDPADVPG
jgi:hypothetical protein